MCVLSLGQTPDGWGDKAQFSQCIRQMRELRLCLQFMQREDIWQLYLIAPAFVLMDNLL